MSPDLPEVAGQGSAPRSSPILIGRGGERSALLRAVLNPPSVVFLEGEAGVGKTRLVEEVLSSSGYPSGRRLLGSCHCAQDPFPLGPVVEALGGVGANLRSDSLGPVAGALRFLLPELASKLPPASEPSGSAAIERHRLFRAIHDLLGALGPSVLVLEDLHWADSGTVELLRFLLARPPANVSLILTFRREQLEPCAPALAFAARVPREVRRETVSLPPLAREEVHDLARAILAGGEVSEQLTRDLHAWTGGSPLAVQEVIKRLVDREELRFDQGRWNSVRGGSLGVPPVLRDALLQRLASLEDPAQRMAEAAAVLAHPAPEELIRATAGLSPSRASQGLCKALGSRVVQERGEGLFALQPPLARQAVYEAIPTPERRAFHLRAARSLEASRGPRRLAEISYHFKQAGKPRLWLHYAEQAAEAASAIGDDRSAVELLEEAFHADDLGLAARVRLATKLGGAALFARVPHRAIPIVSGTLEEEALQPGLRGELRFSLARLLYQTGDSASGYREMVRSTTELRRRPGLAAWAMANLAATWPKEGGAGEDRDWLGRALEAAGNQDDPAVETHVLASRAIVLLNAGDPDGWRAVEEIPWEAGSAKQAMELVRACKYLAGVATLLGHYGRAEAFLDTADRIRLELGNERFGVGLATVESELHWHTGRWDGLEARTRRLVEASGKARVMSGRSELIMGWLLLTRGELEEAKDTLEPVVEALRSARTESLIAAAAGLVRIHLTREDASAAGDVAALGLQVVREKGIWTPAYAVAPAFVEAFLACGKAAEAHELVKGVARSLRGRDAPAGRAGLAACRGLLAEADGRCGIAGRWFARAERSWSRLPNPYGAARARERRGRCMLAQGDSRGGDCLLGALRDFEGLGASWDSARTRALLRTHGVALPYPLRGGRRRYASRLSPREQEVAQLAGLGRTNREIAERLVISRRTVESHVAAAMRKLGVGCRSELRPAPNVASPDREEKQAKVQ